MEAELACERVREALRRAVAAMKPRAERLSERLGWSERHLARLLGGEAPLRFEEVFHLLSVLEVPPYELFFRLFPLGGPRVAALVGQTSQDVSGLGGVSTRELMELSQQQGGQAYPTSIALALRAGQVLGRRIEASGSSRREIARTLGISERALRRSLRGENQLHMGRAFAILSSLGADPGRYFMEVLGPDPTDRVDRFRWSWYLDLLEEHQERVARQAERAADSDIGEGSAGAASRDPEEK